MAVHGRRLHYRIEEITGGHWRDLAEETGIANLWNRMQALVAEVPVAIERVGTRLPRDFPERVYEKTRTGVIGQSARFANTAAIR